jgi:iron complex outermembrane receptor protein
MKLHRHFLTANRVALLLFAGSFCASHAQQASSPGSGRLESEPREFIEEITVTALKKRQAIQEVAAAVTVLDRDALTVFGIMDLAEIQNFVPSIRLQRESASTEIYIRGVGSTLDVPMIEMPNTYNINGVYIPREATSASLFDVDRVEVLPGPQGTLYGRGALGGTINTITVRPGDEMETTALLEVGNYSLVRATATQNIPVSDQLRLRVGISGLFNDGYLASGADSAQDIAGLVSLDATPNDRLSLYFWGHFERKEGKAANLLSKGTFGDPKSQVFPHPDDPWNDLLDGDLSVFATLGPIEAEDKTWRTSIIGGEINWAINDSLSMTYIPSYIDFEWHQNYWLTHKLSDFGEDITQQTHELRLSHDNGGRMSWLAGLYAYRLETRGQLFIQFGPDELFPTAPVLWLDATDVRDHELKGAAMFGELTYSLTDQWRLVAGGRVSRDERTGNGLVPAPFAFAAEPGVVPDDLQDLASSGPFAFPWQNDESWNHVDWKLGLEYDVAADSMIYAVAQTGFQPGTFDTFPGVSTPESELLAYTLGWKNSLLNDRLILNNEVFYYVYDNLLTQAFDAGSGSNRLRNADVTIYGNQLDTIYLPGPNTQLLISIGYLHARYDSFSVPELNVFSGNQLQNAPDWTVVLGASHDFELTSGGSLHAEVNSRYESGYWGDFSHSSGIYQEGYTKTNASLTWHSAKDSWSIGAWIKNIEDQAVQAAAAPGSVFDPGPGAPFLERPRTYGLRFTLHIQ